MNSARRILLQAARRVKPIKRSVFRRRGSLTSNPDNPYQAIRRLNLIGLAVIVVLVGGMGGWASTAHIAGAVIARGSVVVSSDVKKVQHPTGGVVGSILVEDGSQVREGQVVMRIDDTVTRSTLGMVRSQLVQNAARAARLLAERDGAKSIEFPQSLMARKGDKSMDSAISGEIKLFEARRRARLGQKSQLRERIVQTNEEIRGLSAQRNAKEQEIKLISQELVGVTALYEKNLVSVSRLMTLQRDKARLEGERGQYIADIARAQGKISETELQILQLDQDFRSDVLKDLRETQGKVAEFTERVTAAEDQLGRVDIRAPQAGTVLQLTVHTVGGVIKAGETIMEIVPSGDALVIEAKVAPQDIDQVAVGAQAAVRIMAGEHRTMQDIIGVLTRVSADLTRDRTQGEQTGQAYYLVRVSLPKEELRRLHGLRLVPGMPAEVFIQTYDRTPLQYLLKPLRDQVARTFRER